MAVGGADGYGMTCNEGPVKGGSPGNVCSCIEASGRRVVGGKGKGEGTKPRMGIVVRAHSTVLASWVQAGEDAEGEFGNSCNVVRVAYVGS